MYEPTTLQEDFIVKKIVTIHYFEYSKDFVFSGESHNFWEFVYVDKGEIDIYAEDKAFRLSQSEIIFHKPDEWHNVKATGNVAPNLVIIAFECKSRKMNFFKNRIMKLSALERSFLSSIIKEAAISFSSPLGDPFTQKLDKANSMKPVGSEQIIKISLEQLLISLCRNNNVIKKNPSILKERFDDDVVSSVIDFLIQNTGHKLNFTQVVHFAKISPTSLKTIFKAKTQMGVMEYFVHLKIEQAKLFIRENNYNFTQISELLAYESPHHFTKQFKSKTGMTPTEYTKSVKVSQTPHTPYVPLHNNI